MPLLEFPFGMCRFKTAFPALPPTQVRDDFDAWTNPPGILSDANDNIAQPLLHLTTLIASREFGACFVMLRPFL